MLGGITVVLYGMIGLLGAKIWIENRVDFGNPVNLVPASPRASSPDRRRHAEDHRRLRAQGIALGTILVIVCYHVGEASRTGVRHGRTIAAAERGTKRLL